MYSLNFNNSMDEYTTFSTCFLMIYYKQRKVTYNKLKKENDTIKMTRNKTIKH